jgi:hypothetical protein
MVMARPAAKLPEIPVSVPGVELGPGAGGTGTALGIGTRFLGSPS